jgi:hypothetical protein
MLTIIIIIAIAVILISVFATTKHNNDVRTTNIDNGGLRNSFGNFTKYISEVYQMQFDADTGRYFSYSKSVTDKNNNSGKLFIGIKLNMKNELVLFSKFKNEYRGEYNGMDISGVYFDNNDSIDKCIKISLGKLKTEGVLDYLNHSAPISVDTTKTPKPKHTDIKTISKDEFEHTIKILLAKKELASVLLMLHSYMECYPDEKDRLEKLKTKVEDEYYESDEYLNSDLPF